MLSPTQALVSLSHLKLKPHFLRMPAPKKFPVKPSEADIVFVNPNTGNPWSSTNSIRDQWVDVLRKAGVRYRVPYQTRHTYASTMLQVGEDLEYVAEQMGHETSITTLKHYARFIKNTGVKHGSKLEAAYELLRQSRYKKRCKTVTFLSSLKIISL